MTISSTTRIAGPYIGNGTATVFAFTFKVFAASDLDVVRLNTSTGVESTLVLSSDYSVTLNGDQNSNPGGSITLLAGALAAGFTLTITSDIANLQPTDLTNQGGFYPEVITDALDRATIQIQQLSTGVARSIKIPIGDGLTVSDLPGTSQRQGKYIAFDASGQPIASVGTGTDTSLRTDLAASSGSSLVGHVASGTGAVSRTVQSKLRDVVHVEDFGAVGDGVSDDTTAIQNAINAASTTGAGTVLLDARTYGISSTITLPSCVTLQGMGSGQYPTNANKTSPLFTGLPKTRLLALSAFTAGTAMLSAKTAAASNYPKQGIQVHGVMLDCDLKADIGMETVTVKHCHFSDILVFRPNTIGVLEDCLADTAGTQVTQTNSATQFCTWTGITVWLDSTVAAVGWRITGNNSYNVNQNTYVRLMIVHGDGTGMDMVDCDTLSFVGLTTYAFGQGFGCVMHGSDPRTPAKYCRKISMVDTLFGGANLNFGVAQAGASNTITLAAGASSVASAYNGKYIILTAGTGVNQRRLISTYNSTTKVATVSANWTITPDTTTIYQIEGCGGIQVKKGLAETGTAQAGAATTITLNAASSDLNSAYNGCFITITGGTGSGQTKQVDSYNGTTKVATIFGTWTTSPDNTSTYEIVGANSSGHFSHGFQSVGNGGKDPLLEPGTSFSYKDERVEYMTDTVFPRMVMQTMRPWSGTGGSGGHVSFEGISGDLVMTEYGRVSSLQQGTASISESGRIDVQTNQGRRIGTAAGGGASTITLDAGSSSIQNYYVGQTVYLTSGTGAGQNRYISAYDAATRVATVSSAWTTAPIAGTGFEILGSLTSKMYVASGVVVDDVDTLTPAISDKGQGTVNCRNGYYIQNTAILTGSGTPESVVTAPVGSLFLRTNGGAGTTLYVKESGAGNTGWVAK